MENKNEYKYFRLGKTTEIIAKTIKVITIIALLLLMLPSVFSKNYHHFKGDLAEATGYILGLILLAFLVFFLIFRLSKKFFNPMINLHKNTILLFTNKITIHFYKKKWKNSLIVLIILSLPSLILILSFIINRFFSLKDLILTVMILLPLIPHYIFLIKTKMFFKDLEQEKQNDITEIIL